MTGYSAEEMMVVAASRLLVDDTSCFLGIGLPTRSALLARRTHAPNLKLIYESGCVGPNPVAMPSSIGDGDLLSTAEVMVGVPFLLNYLLMAGRVDTGFLGAAQVDKYGNLNTTVIGTDYRHPHVRLAGPGASPEVGFACGHVYVMLNQTPRTFVEKVDFVTCFGFGSGKGERERFGMPGRGPTLVITDLGLLRPDPHTSELTLTAVYPGVQVDDVIASTGWALKVIPDADTVSAPTEEELTILRGRDTWLRPHQFRTTAAVPTARGDHSSARGS